MYSAFLDESVIISHRFPCIQGISVAIHRVHPSLEIGVSNVKASMEAA